MHEDVGLSDLTDDDLAHWIAAWLTVEEVTRSLTSKARAVADAGMMVGVEVSYWYELRDELLAEYARRQKPDPQP